MNLKEQLKKLNDQIEVIKKSEKDLHLHNEVYAGLYRELLNELGYQENQPVPPSEFALKIHERLSNES